MGTEYLVKRTIMEALSRIITTHLEDDKNFHTTILAKQDKIERVLFGSEEEQEIGLVAMTKDMHQILTSFRFILIVAKWVAPVALLVAIIKGWGLALLAFLVPK